MNDKPIILLVWGYHRKGWLHAFNQLNNDYNFHYIFHLSKPDNEVNHSKSDNIHYWSDFQSAQDIIKKISPSKVVFMGINSPNTIALNLVAKRKKIETIILQHGMFHKYADYLRLAKEEMAARIKTNNFERSKIKVDRFFLLIFLLRSVALITPMVLLYVFKLTYLKRKYLEVEALKKAPSKFRRPNKYIVFTKDNASIYMERDKVAQEQLTEIGNPEMDMYFNSELTKKYSESNYYLLIDQPWSEVKEYSSPGFGVSKEQTNAFYTKLADYASSQSAKLKVKLHPYSYESTFLIPHPNIEYLKDVDMVELVLNSKGVFGFSSTLTLPAIYFGKCCLFKIWEQSSYQNEIEELKVAQVLDYHTFTIENINFKSIEKETKYLELFVKKYLYKVDSGAIDRLKQILS